MLSSSPRSFLAGTDRKLRSHVGLGSLTVATSLLLTTAAFAETPERTSNSPSKQTSSSHEGGAKANTPATDPAPDGASENETDESGDASERDAPSDENESDATEPERAPAESESKFQYDDVPSPARTQEGRSAGASVDGRSYRQLVFEREALQRKRSEHGVGGEVTMIVFGGLLTAFGGLGAIYSFSDYGSDEGKALSVAALGGGGLLLGFGISNLKDELRERRKYKQKIDKIDEQLRDSRVEIGLMTSGAGANLVLRGAF